MTGMIRGYPRRDARQGLGQVRDESRQIYPSIITRHNVSDIRWPPCSDPKPYRNDRLAPHIACAPAAHPGVGPAIWGCKDNNLAYGVRAEPTCGPAAKTVTCLRPHLTTSPSRRPNPDWRIETPLIGRR